MDNTALRKMWVDLQAAVLSAPVREEAADPKRITGSRKEDLERLVRGITIIVLFAHLEEMLGPAQWSEAKKAGSKLRTTHPGIEWWRFDVLKYVRDCCAHRSTGEMFAPTAPNTIEFVKQCTAHAGNTVCGPDPTLPTRVSLPAGICKEAYAMIDTVFSAIP